MLIKLTNPTGKKFLLNTDFIFEVEEKKEPDLHNSIIRMINNRESLVKETVSQIEKLANLKSIIEK